MAKDAKTVFVGLSGGVDSSVAAGLLKDAGYKVEGVFIKVWRPPFLKCSWSDDRLDAMRVCAHLEIPFRDLDLSGEYKSEVVDYMVSEYKRGRTPNPDVMCNKHIKFGKFLDYAKREGAEYVATGHYARVEKRGGEFILKKGKDENKDQSYFLWTLGKDELENVWFPIGDYKKSETRKLAEKFGLPTASKKESQGLCFLGEIDLKEFLGEFMELKSGDVLDEDGNKIGAHDGAIIYTVGQRHGFRVKSEKGSPHYVISRDMSKNTITVSTKPPTLDIKDSYKLEDINWISGNPKEDYTYFARIRHQGSLIPCNIIDSNKVKFLSKVDSLAAGQSLVLYVNELCIGGGVIE